MKKRVGGGVTEQVHLTLKFLGDVRDSLIPQVCDVITGTASECEAFDLRIQGLGVFGRPARVVWAGCEVPPELMKIQTRLESEFEKIGWDKEQPTIRRTPDTVPG